MQLHVSKFTPFKMEMENKAKDPLRLTYKVCFVPQCQSTTVKTPRKVFIHVPREKETRTVWAKAAGFPVEKLRLTSYICEDHFSLKEDLANYMEWRFTGVRKIMKAGIYPRFFSCQVKPPMTEPKTELNSSEVSLLPVFHEISSIDMEKKVGVSIVSQNADKMNKLAHSGASFRIFNVDCGVQTDLQHTNKSVQVKPFFRSVGINCRPHDIPMLMKTSATGDHVSPLEKGKRNIFNQGSDPNNPTAVKLLLNNIFTTHTKLLIENDPFLFLGIRKNSMYVVDELIKLSGISKKNVYLVFKKIRLNSPNAVLAYEFGYSVDKVSRVFQSNLSVISKLLRKLIVWPPEEDIASELPIEFRLIYGNVQSVLDFFHIQVKCRNAAADEIQTRPQCEEREYTSKFLISITPKGSINFISNGHDVHINSMEIVEKSGYMKFLPPKSVVMTEYSFGGIETLLLEQECTLIRPPNVNMIKKKLKGDVNPTKNFNAMLMHMRRVLKQMTKFEMIRVHATIDENWDSINHIVVIAAALVNLQIEKKKCI